MSYYRKSLVSQGFAPLTVTSDTRTVTMATAEELLATLTRQPAITIREFEYQPTSKHGKPVGKPKTYELRQRVPIPGSSARHTIICEGQEVSPPIEVLRAWVTATGRTPHIASSPAAMVAAPA